MLLRSLSDRALQATIAHAARKPGVDYVELSAQREVHGLEFGRSFVRPRSLPLAQRQAGWSRVQPAYSTIGDEQARQMMHALDE